MSEKTELELLKERATKLGIKFGGNIGVDALKEKINQELGEEDTEPKEEELSVGEQRAKKRAEASKLIRVRVNCMNPNKAEWEGELFTVGNSVVGSFKKFVPFNLEEGWHIPQIIYNTMKNRECQIFVTKKDSRGNKTRVGKLIKEFAIEVLPPLSEEELKELATKQSASQAID
jgi:hypothetical protein